MGVFDRIIDEFSAKDLRARVKGVMIFGAILVAIIAAGLAIVLLPTYTISIPGTARWQASAPSILEIAVEPGMLQKIVDQPSEKLELLDPPRGRVTVDAALTGVDPQRNVAQFDGSGVPAGLRNLPHIDARIIVVRRPMWRLLWGK